MNINLPKRNRNRANFSVQCSSRSGVITMWVLVFGTAFLIMLTGLVGFLAFQIKQNQKLLVSNEAFHIAGAGINYARWHLAHNPEDYNFSGVYDYKNPEGTTTGQYQLSVIPPTGCDYGVKIQSTGWKSGFEDSQRTIQVKYAKPALTKYAFLSNSNIWFGPDEQVSGPFHSNGGIRMDGTQNSLSTSAKETYICGVHCLISGCVSPCIWIDGLGCQCPGIWGEGAGGGEGLWEFPVSNIDYDKIIQDLAALKEKAMISGVYFPPTEELGYYIEFLSNGTFDVYKVTELETPVWYHNGQEWVKESNDVKEKTPYGNFSVPADCAPVFVEDDVWIAGIVKGRVTVAAARLPDFPGLEAKMVIPNNIDCVGTDSVLGLIGQKDILIPFYSPDNLEIEASMLAQKGHVFRYYYPPWDVWPYNTYSKREYLAVFGSIITNSIWTFTWEKETGRSGYQTTTMSYDPDLTYTPPPYFPVSGEYEMISWEETD